MPLHLLQPAAAEPIFLAAAKLHLRVDHDDEDLLIQGLISAAREYAEHETGRILVASKCRFTLDDFPAGMGRIRLDIAPVVSIDAVTYLDSNDETQSLADNDYGILKTEPAYLYSRNSGTWPQTSTQPGSVMVDLTAGYAAPMIRSGNAIVLSDWPQLDLESPIFLSNSGGTLPAPLNPGLYYIDSQPAAKTYTLATSPAGDPITLTTAGTGQHFAGSNRIPQGIIQWMLLRLTSLYENKGEDVQGRGAFYHLPHVDRLLDPYRLPRL